MPRPVVPIARAARGLLARVVERAVPLEDHVRAARDAHARRVAQHAARRERVELAEQDVGIDDDAGPDQVHACPGAARRPAPGAARSSRRPRRACGRRCCRRGSARRGRRAARASRRSCPCPRRPTGRPTAISVVTAPSSSELRRDRVRQRAQRLEHLLRRRRRRRSRASRPRRASGAARAACARC